MAIRNTISDIGNQSTKHEEGGLTHAFVHSEWEFRFSKIPGFCALVGLRDPSM